MSAVLNIGLVTNDTPPRLLDADAVIAALPSGSRVTRVQWQMSLTEPTLVIEVHRALTKEEATAVAVMLHRDCIAQLPMYGAPFLAGPRADAWGPFNKDRFLTLR